MSAEIQEEGLPGGRLLVFRTASRAQDSRPLVEEGRLLIMG